MAQGVKITCAILLIGLGVLLATLLAPILIVIGGLTVVYFIYKAIDLKDLMDDDGSDDEKKPP